VPRRACLLAACVGVATGCGAKALYDWGPYEESLQASYVTHDDATAWSALEATIASAERAGHRVPPGVCAEYGFLLYKRGRRDAAIQYFEREARLFPESKPLMDRLVAKIREQATSSAADVRPENGPR